MTEIRFEIDDLSIFSRICGRNDSHLKIFEEISEVKIIPRGNTLIIEGQKRAVDSVDRLLHSMADVLHTKGNEYEFEEFDVRYLAGAAAKGKTIKPQDIHRLKVHVNDTGKTILPRTLNQADYIQAIHTKPITFGIGPAGTGKTYLAVVMALHFYFSGKVRRIVLTRPAVEAGESLGYLPGDLVQKINPYLRPLYDALFDLLSVEKVSKLIENETIEIAPLAYMRGRTLNNAFIILDEAQNTTISQMKMFLTRMGNNSRVVISGDITQIDLEKNRHSGLLQVIRILKDIEDISFINFTREDICRHPVVEKIVAAYERSGYAE